MSEMGFQRLPGGPVGGEEEQKPTRLTAILLPDSRAALERAAELTGDSLTTCLNRAIQTYAYLEGQAADGWKVALTKGTTLREVSFT